MLSMVSNLKIDLKVNIKVDPKVDLSPGNKLFDPIAVWLNKPVNKWKLLYKYTKDEKTSLVWHAKCDGKGPTVTVIWANSGYIFGGYAHLSWKSNGTWEESKESFLFSLTDGKNRKPFQCLPYQSFGNCLEHEPDRIAFGSGRDLKLLFPPNTSGSYSDLGSTYKIPDGFDGKTFLAGSYHGWTIEEVETYLV